MNLQKLYEAQAIFLDRYPQGFASESMQQVAKRHNVDKMTELAKSALARKKFDSTAQVLDDIIKIVSRSSMVSMFEKPKFRDFVNGLARDDRARLAEAFKRQIHTQPKRGFTEVVEILAEAKLAKWSLLTACAMYYRPQKDVFVKPTTTKNVIRYFEIEDLEYKPRPSWDFYERYRALINDMKGRVDPSLSPTNAAFTGFLMITTTPPPE